MGLFELDASVIAIAGDTGRWAIVGDQSYEIGILVTSDPDGPWKHSGPTWFPNDFDLYEIYPPREHHVEGFDKELSDLQRNLLAR